MLRSTTAVLGVTAFVLGVGASFAGGCSLTTLDVLECRTDSDCTASLGADQFCSRDGYCRPLPDAPGRCRGIIDVRLFADLRGPQAADGLPYFKGQIDLLRQINDEGGIRGCPVVVNAADDQSDPSLARKVLDGWVAQPQWADVVTVFDFWDRDVADAAAFLPELETRGVLSISASPFGALSSPRPVELRIDVPGVDEAFEPVQRSESRTAPGYPLHFFAGTDDATAGRIAMGFAADEGARKVAFFACDDDACQRPLAAIKTHAAADLDLALGRDLSLDLAWTQAETQDAVLAFFADEVAHRASNPGYVVPDWVWVGGPTQTAGAVGAAVGRVRTEMALDVRVMVDGWGVDERLFAACGDGCVDYLYGVTPFAAYGDDVPGMDRLVEVHDKWRAIDAAGWDGNPEEVDAQGDALHYESIRYVQGYVSVQVWRAAVERAVDLRKAIDGSGLRDVLESFDALSTDGLTGTLSFSHGDHRPQGTARIYRIGPGGALTLVPGEHAVALEPSWLGW